MYDINFLDHYKPQPKKTDYFRIILVITLIVAIVVIGVLEVGFSSKKAEISKKTKDYLKKTEEKSMIDQLQEIANKEAINIQLNSVINKLKVIENYMQVKGIVHPELLRGISKSVPEDCFIKSLDIGENNISLSGSAMSFVSSANFQKQLRENKNIAIVSLSDITENNGNYDFNMAAMIKVEVPSEIK